MRCRLTGVELVLASVSFEVDVEEVRHLSGQHLGRNSKCNKQCRHGHVWAAPFFSAWSNYFEAKREEATRHMCKGGSDSEHNMGQE